METTTRQADDIRAIQSQAGDPRDDPRYVDSDSLEAVLRAWGGADEQSCTMDMGGWADDDESAFRAAVQAESVRCAGEELGHIVIERTTTTTRTPDPLAEWAHGRPGALLRPARVDGALRTVGTDHCGHAVTPIGGALLPLVHCTGTVGYDWRWMGMLEALIGGHLWAVRLLVVHATEPEVLADKAKTVAMVRETLDAELHRTHAGYSEADAAAIEATLAIIEREGLADPDDEHAIECAVDEAVEREERAKAIEGYVREES